MDSNLGPYNQLVGIIIGVAAVASRKLILHEVDPLTVRFR